MKIHNIRLGHACNSSSTHSVVVVNNSVQEVSNHDNEFGWGNFVLSQAESKNHYMAAQLAGPFSSSFGFEFAQVIINHLTGIMIDDDYDHNVDHQSQWVFPKYHSRSCVYNVEFLKDAISYLKSKNVVVVGGNDNDYGNPNAPFDSIHSPLNNLNSMHDYNCDVIARKDTLGYWVLFDRNTGNKVRFSFDSNAANITRSTCPELVDVKITNACNKGCAFCYQGSTKEGKHADYSEILNLKYQLQRYEVLEVALGGGEPTQHPNFVQIIKEFRQSGIVPNFTTATLDWMADKEMLDAVYKNCGSFAYSVQTMKDMQKFVGMLKRHWKEQDSWARNRENCKPTVQVVLGVITMNSLTKVASLCRNHHVPLTVLGYKDCARGKGYKKRPYGDWMERIKLADLGHYGIDTSVVKEFPELKEKVQLYDQTVTEHEGTYSMYVDMVERKFGPSSYCQPEEMIELKPIGYYGGFDIKEMIKVHYPTFYK